MQFHIEQSKAAEGDFSRNSIPGVIDCKSDYSENGSLEKPKQLQSEYWVIMYYTLLISIASFLVSEVWLERESVLPIGAEVTVEPEDYKPLADGKIEAVKGSFWARVEILLDAAGNAARTAHAPHMNREPHMHRTCTAHEPRTAHAPHMHRT